MAKSYLIELILRTVKQGTGGKDIAKEFGDVEKSAEKATKGLGGLSSILKAGAVGMGAATTALFALKKAMDLGKEGAAIIQTGESFEFLLEKVGASADLLEQLRDASRGTISDMDLMTSTSTLLAGAQGELATSLANATPRLMEIAKAANKLNPSLGDTTFLYQSLATGIKRASPLILDNLGLTIKVGEANEKFAASLGKTVEELTAEEQKMALLQETMRAGSVLISQAGSSTESATDAFAQLGASLTNLTDHVKAELAPAISSVAQKLNEMIDVALDADDRIRKLAGQVTSGGASYEDYVNAVLEAAVAEKQLTESGVDALRQFLLLGASVKETDAQLGRFAGATDRVRQKYGLLTESEWNAIKAAEGLTFAHEELRLGLVKTSMSAEDVEQATRDAIAATDVAQGSVLNLAYAQDAAIQAAQDATLAEEEQTQALRDLGTQLGLNQDQIDNYVDTLGYTESELKAVADDLNITGGEFDKLSEKTGISREALERLHSEFGMGEDAILAYVEKIRDAQRAYEGLIGTLSGGITDLRDLGQAEQETAQDYEAQLAELDKKAKQVYGSIATEFKASLPNPTTVAERMKQTEDVWDEWGLRLQDIIVNGVQSPYAQMLQEMGMQKPPEQNWKQWAADLKSAFYAGELPDLLPPDWQQKIAEQQQAATAATQAEAAKRVAAVEAEKQAIMAAREEQLAAERQARQDATLELSLQIAEQTGVLEAWSQQQFGPDFSGVADTAEEVLGLIDSGMITIDEKLAGIIGNTAAGIQNALDMTGAAAEENKALLNTILSDEWAQAQKEKLETALDLQAALPPEDVEQLKATVQQGIDEAVPEGPFAELTTAFQGVSTAIGGELGTLTGNFGGFYDEVTADSTTASEQMASDFSTAADDMKAAMDDLRSMIVGAMDAIAGSIDPVIEQLDNVAQGTKRVSRATETLRTKVVALTNAYYALADATSAAGVTIESPPKLMTAAQMIGDAYTDLAYIIGNKLGMAFSDLAGAGKEFFESIEPSAWIARFNDLVAMGSKLEGIGGFFGKMVEEDMGELEAQMNSLNYQIRRMDRALAMPETLTRDEYNRILAERTMLMAQVNSLQEEYNQQQAAVSALQAEQEKLDLLEQQVKLLDLMAQYGLDAQSILAGIKLGEDIDPLQMAIAMRRALQQISGHILEGFVLEGYQHGGQFTVPGSGAPDSVPVRFMASPGETVTVTPQYMMPPPNPRYGGEGAERVEQSTTMKTVNMTITPSIYTRMDEAEFAVRVERAVRRALEG